MVSKWTAPSIRSHFVPSNARPAGIGVSSYSCYMLGAVLVCLEQSASTVYAYTVFHNIYTWIPYVNILTCVAFPLLPLTDSLNKGQRSQLVY